MTGDPTIFGNLCPAEEIIEAVVESVRSMRYNGYAPSTGNYFLHSLCHFGIGVPPEGKQK